MRKILRFRRTPAGDDAMRELLGELNATRGELANAYARFNYTVEPELVEACVYEINAIQSRYGYLLRVIKENGGGTAAFEAQEGEGAAWV